MTRLLCLILAIVGALSGSALAMAQSDSPANAQATTRMAPAGLPAPAVTAAQAAHKATKWERYDPSKPIGIASLDELEAPVPPDVLDQFRSDLISLANELSSESVGIAEHAASTGFTEDRVQALSDEELTVFYNSIADPTALHLAVASLRQLRRSAANSQSTAPAPANGAVPSKGDAPDDVPVPLPSNPFGSMAADALPEPLTPPVYYTGNSCTGTRTDDGVNYGLHVARNALKIAFVTAEGACASIAVILGEGSNAIACAIEAIAGAAVDSMEFAIDLREFCDGTISDANLDALYENLLAINANLMTHDTIEKAFLKEMRILFIRKETEKNLLLTGDQRLSLFQLPETPMQHEGVSIQNTRDIVLDTIQRNQLAGMPIGNAQTLFNDGNALLAQNKYKDAYARYRSAYQAAINQTVR